MVIMSKGATVHRALLKSQPKRGVSVVKHSLPPCSLCCKVRVGLLQSQAVVLEEKAVSVLVQSKECRDDSLETIVATATVYGSSIDCLPQDTLPLSH